MVNGQEATLRLRQYLLDGIAREIFEAEEAYSLAQEIGNYAQEINTASYGELFGRLQIILSDRQTLSVLKMFDPVKRYPTRSIPGTLSLLEDNSDLWELPERQELQRVLVEAGSNTAEIEHLGKAELTRVVVEHYRSTLPDPRTLRQLRDKVIAHNEAIDRDALNKVTWGQAISLVTYAKHFVAAVGCGYLGMYFNGDGDDYLLTRDARRTSTGLRRLLRAAGIAEDSLR